MSPFFPFGPVSTTDQTAGLERKGFAELLDKLASGDVLRLTKLDRLDRTAMDVRSIVERLDPSGVSLLLCSELP